MIFLSFKKFKKLTENSRGSIWLKKTNKFQKGRQKEQYVSNKNKKIKKGQIKLERAMERQFFELID